MKKSRYFIAMLFVFSIMSGALIAENLQVSIANLVHGSQIDDCQDFIVKLNASVENSTVHDVRVYVNNVQIARVRHEPWEAEWNNLVSGYYRLYAKATDEEDNEAFSDTIGVYVGDVQKGNLILNSYFNCNTRQWSTQNNEGAQSSIIWEENAGISEGGAVYIDIINGSTVDWHIQMLQAFPIDSGHTYEISFISETPSDKTISWAMQENGGDYEYYGGGPITISGNGYFGPFEFIAPKTDTRNAFKLYVGGNNIPIYFDDIMIIDNAVEFPEVVVDVEKTEGERPDKYTLLSSYPNPFNSTTVIQYSLPSYSHVDLRVMNIRGQLVKTLINRHQHSGEHQIQWNGTDETGTAMSSGSYVVQLTTKTDAKTRIQTTKIMLLE
ncbi:carbohydrate binding domain-containing protein [bacterium]|nr:carbohydrate binding domain-containing protein [bacterium]